MGPRAGGRGYDDHRNHHGNNLIAKYSFEEIMKDGPISKLISTKTGHKPTQYKKIVDTLPVLCVDKNYKGFDEVLQTGNDLVEANFMPLYPDAIKWSTTHQVQVSSVNSLDVPAANGSYPPI